MPNYQEGKIYKIYNTINDDIYVGSTTQKLCERMREHRYCITYAKAGKQLIYKAFREHGVDNFYIELIEKCPCNERQELRRKEGEYIRSLKPSLNKRMAGRTDYEYQEDNREHKKEYYQNNKEDMNEYMKQYRKTTKNIYLKKKKNTKNITKTLLKHIGQTK